jgi:hypothetical protein
MFNKSNILSKTQSRVTRTRDSTQVREISPGVCQQYKLLVAILQQLICPNPEVCAKGRSFLSKATLTWLIRYKFLRRDGFKILSLLNCNPVHILRFIWPYMLPIGCVDSLYMTTHKLRYVKRYCNKGILGVARKCVYTFCTGRSHWPLCLRQEISSPAQALGSWVRIPLEAWKSVCVYFGFMLSCVGGGLAAGLSTRPRGPNGCV